MHKLRISRRQAATMTAADSSILYLARSHREAALNQVSGSRAGVTGIYQRRTLSFALLRRGGPKSHSIRGSVSAQAMASIRTFLSAAAPQ